MRRCLHGTLPKERPLVEMHVTLPHADREGEMMIFDDSYEHEVWQLSKKEGVRVVLLIRFWHPDIPPARWPEAEQHMKRLYRRHIRRLQLPPLERPANEATPLLKANAEDGKVV